MPYFPPQWFDPIPSNKGRHQVLMNTAILSWLRRSTLSLANIPPKRRLWQSKINKCNRRWASALFIGHRFQNSQESRLRHRPTHISWKRSLELVLTTGKKRHLNWRSSGDAKMETRDCVPCQDQSWAHRHLIQYQYCPHPYLQPSNPIQHQEVPVWTRTTWRPGPPLSTLVLRSKGPAKHGLLPDRTRSRTWTRTTSLAPTSTNTSEENPMPPDVKAQPDPAPTLTQLFWSSGWWMLGKIFSRSAPEAKGLTNLAYINSIENLQSSADSSEQEDVSSFF